MYNNLEPINKVTDKDISIKEVKDYSFSKEQMNSPITISEFYEACKDYPIFFVKDNNNSWMATAMLGYKEKQNTFVDEKGTWAKHKYVPAHIRRYPFIFVTDNKSSQLTLGVEKDYKIKSQKEKNRKLFDKDGNNSEFLNGILGFLNQYHKDFLETASFIKQLDEWELLEEKNAKVVISKDEQYNVNGFYVVNEEKLKHLSKKRKEELFNKNATPLITAHLISLSNIQKFS
jgi:hypothetical protein